MTQSGLSLAFGNSYKQHHIYKSSHKFVKIRLSHLIKIESRLRDKRQQVAANFKIKTTDKKMFKCLYVEMCNEGWLIFNPPTCIRWIYLKRHQDSAI